MNTLKSVRETRTFKFLLTVLIAFGGGLLFSSLRIPLGWMIGPITFVLIATKVFKIGLYWIVPIRNFGLILIGYNCGLSFNQETLQSMSRQLHWMVIMSVTLIILGALFSYLISKITKIEYPTVLLAGIPGGLSQMIMLAEELESVDITYITFFHVSRVILIFFCVPFLVYSPLYSFEPSSAAARMAAIPADDLLSRILLYATVAVISAVVAKKIKLPTAYLLGPIIGVAVLNISGLQGPVLPASLLNLAQLIIGIHIGLMLKPEKLQNKLKTVTTALINGLALIVISFGLSLFLVKALGIGSLTAFLSMVPGGPDQMCLLASVTSSDVAAVTAFQVTRMLFIYFVVPPSIRCYTAYFEKRHPREPEINTTAEGCQT